MDHRWERQDVETREEGLEATDRQLIAGHTKHRGRGKGLTESSQALGIQLYWHWKLSICLIVSSHIA